MQYRVVIGLTVTTISLAIWNKNFVGVLSVIFFVVDYLMYGCHELRSSL